MVLVNSRTQQILPAKQTTSIIKIQVKPSFFEVGITGIFHWEALDPGHFALLISPTPGGNCQLTIPLVLPQEETDDMCDSEQRLLSQISLELCLLRHFLFI